MADVVARGAEQHRGLGLVEAQQVDHRVLDVRRRDRDRLVGDVAVAAIVVDGRDAQRVVLVALGERDDRPRHGRREQQRAARRRAWRRGFPRGPRGSPCRASRRPRRARRPAGPTGRARRARGGRAGGPGCRRRSCAPWASARRSFDASMPPTQVDDPRAGLGVEPVELAATCSASSRVGAMTSASGPEREGGAAVVVEELRAPWPGRSTVLPEPVCAETIRSRPSASGSRPRPGPGSARRSRARRALRPASREGIETPWWPNWKSARRPVRSGSGKATRGTRIARTWDAREKSGAGEGIRTLDPNLGKVVLYP